MNANVPEIDIAINDDAWLALLGSEKQMHALSESALSAAANVANLKWPSHAELSIVFTNDDEMAELNKQWRDIDKSTNVLSFPGSDVSVGEEADALIGDIILAHETISQEAIAQEKSFNAHLSHLLVHGFLHLFGYDHIEDDEAQIMETLEIKILQTLEISNPYH
ncbi:MAG: rRNA maturation RNase YbeY [Nitratireductor sp.]